MTCCGHKEQAAFRPDLRTKALTVKFYARHDQFVWKDGDKTKNVAYYEDQIEQRLKYDPRMHSLAPVTENQVYGWLEEKAMKYEDEKDGAIMFYPKRSDETSRVLRKIAYEMGVERRRFNPKK